MKFDCIIMNPPYDRSLHLKILAEAITNLKDSESKVVNLSPVRWLQDPLAKFKKNSDFHKFEESVKKHLTTVEVVDKLSAQELFNGTVFGANLAIYECSHDAKGDFNCESLQNPILLKILAKQTSCIEFELDKKDGFRVRFPFICNNGGSGTGRKVEMASFGKVLWFEDGMKDGKPWHAWYTHNQHTKTTDTIPCSAKFNSELEAENFCKQFHTTFAKVYTHWMKSDVHVTPEIVLYMANSLNPRTGKLGYESEWTDDDFRKFFGITDEEWNTIETIMEKYK